VSGISSTRWATPAWNFAEPWPDPRVPSWKQNERFAGFYGACIRAIGWLSASDMRASNGKDVEERLGELKLAHSLKIVGCGDWPDPPDPLLSGTG